MDHYIPTPQPPSDPTHNYHYNCCSVSNYMVDYTVSTSKAVQTHRMLYWGAAIQHAGYWIGIMSLTNTWSPAATTERPRLLSCTGEDCNTLPYGQRCKGILTCLLLLTTARINYKLVTSGFRREVDDISSLLGHYTACSGISLPTFRDNRSVSS